MDMTPTEFELHAKSLLEKSGNEIVNWNIQHNQKEKGYDGDYQIDIKVTVNFLGVDIIILVECKHYKSNITREKLQILREKLNSLGAHKGIVMSINGFQSGAVRYAEAHGIALIEVKDGSMRYETKYMTMNDFRTSRHNPYESNDEPIFYWIESSSTGYKSIYLNDEYLEEFYAALFAK